MRTTLLILAALTSTAHAQAKYTRKQNVAIPVKLSDRVKPQQPPPAEKAKPTLPPDAILRVYEQAQPIRREQEAILEKLIKDTPDDDPDKPDFMFRLAEHYAQQLRFWRIKAVEATMPDPSRTDRTDNK